MKSKRALIGFLVLGSAQLLAQQTVIEGRVTNKADVENIHILNTTSRYNSITGANGNFSIRAKLNDTLVISSVHYLPEKVVVGLPALNGQKLEVALRELVNELGEVKLGRTLTGDLGKDIKNIKTQKPLNFDDVGIPGFKGTPEEKIVPIVPSVGLITAVDLEVLYKHISGYYKKLKKRRKWESRHATFAAILGDYSAAFFETSYEIPQDRVYDFVLFCMETTTLESDHKKENYANVLATFKQKAPEYVGRLNKE